jgi:hypothetical protein
MLRNGYGGQAKVTKVLSVLQTENAEGRGPQSKIANRKSKFKIPNPKSKIQNLKFRTGLSGQWSPLA